MTDDTQASVARLKRIARRITPSEQRAAAFRRFAYMGLDADDVSMMAESVGLEAADLLSVAGSDFVEANHNQAPQIAELYRMMTQVHREVCGDTSWLLRRLSVTERELYDVASETPVRGIQLCLRAGHDLTSHTKHCLSLLVKLGLLVKVPQRGYARKSQDHDWSRNHGSHD